MFDDLFKSSEEKAQAEAEEHFAKGMKDLEGKFFNGAMIEFKKALDLAHDLIYPKLLAELDSANSGNQLEAALSIGLNLLKDNNQDFELANKLGNYARELGNYAQAEGLYKMALRVNSHFEKAFYNLAACAARVDTYDDAVKSAISQFDKVEDFVLPDYMGEDPNPGVAIMTRLVEQSEVNFQKSLEERRLTIAKAEKDGNLVEASQLRAELKQLGDKAGKITPIEVIAEFDKLVASEPEKAKQHLYNKGLYALSVHLSKPALEAFEQLSVAEFDLIELLKAIALDFAGQRDEAINLVTKNLGENEFSRYNNVNLGLLFKRAGKRFLSAKYLIKTANLLEKSGGIYSMRELVRIAYQSLDEQNFKKAANYLEIAVTEMPDIKMWTKLGETYAALKKYDEAASAFRKALEMDPNDPEANQKIKEVHNYYADKAKGLEAERKLKPAAEYYTKALTILKVPDTMKRAASVFKSLNNLDEADKLIFELHAIEQAERDQQMEVERQAKIKSAKQAMAQRNFRKAVELFEEVFRMKVDKNIFLQLAALYKGMKKFAELEELTQRWAKMVEREEKMRLYDREQARALSE
ncbi:MAG: hypothetical protein A2508_02670 [Candidatus Lambdaproteobacteria bacterium RIFOXYD12_FULL_49_8]|nr:MAG: hypothetical protein A2508_02670 [Candidatus Lambdaproteobacteria bacterium RIFOXYD12_FULL_49_8]